MKQTKTLDRRTVRWCMATILLLVVNVTANAYSFSAENDDSIPLRIYYNITSEEELTVEVVNGGIFSPFYYIDVLSIPETVCNDGITYTVTSIGSSAFNGCTELTEVTIPNSVTTIGDYAFRSCSGLTEITIPNSVTEIGKYAFGSCMGLTEVTIPNSVAEIGEYAFGSCTGLTEVTIGNNVTTISSYAFYNCSGLTEVNFNATACTSAGSFSSGAFNGCDNITTFNFGDNVTIIPNYLCIYLYGLTKVSIPNSVTTIGSYAFYNCSGLTEVTIGNSVTSIGEGAFEYCSGLTEVTIGNSVTEIGSYAFYGCIVLASIYSLNPTPQTCFSGTFSNVVTRTCVLYVPEGTLEAYFSAPVWRDFLNIIDNQPNAIGDIMINGNAVATSYNTLNGKQVSAPQRGINIVRYSDGTARKVVVR